MCTRTSRGWRGESFVEFGARYDLAHRLPVLIYNRQVSNAYELDYI